MTDISTLHLIRTSAFNNNNLSSCLNTLLDDDAVILLDDGCYCLQHVVISKLFDKNIKLYFIDEHVKARGILLSNKQTEQFKSIDLTALLHLTMTYTKTITWQ